MTKSALQRASIKRFLPIGVIALTAAGFFASGAYKYISLETLRDNQAELKAFVSEHYLQAAVLYALAYIAVVALSLPGGLVMSLIGGFLFGAGVGTFIVVISATIGATIIFFAAKTALGDTLRKRAGPFVKKMEDGFQKNAFSFLLLLRLLPVLPFVVVNIAPALFEMRLSTFAAATLIGIIPGTFAYVSAGSGLRAAIQDGGDIDPVQLLLKPEIVTPIIALSLLALLPIVMKAFGVNPLGKPGSK